jgi:hypothetical protein
LISKKDRRDLRNAIEELKTHLDQAYDSILRQIAAVSDTELDLARQVLMWVTIMLPRTLTATDLLCLLKIAPDVDEIQEIPGITPEWILSICGRLLSISGGECRVQFTSA